MYICPKIQRIILKTTNHMSTDRKKQYIGKAIKILKQEGFRLSLDDMATKMGITKKTLYNNFSSKEELLKECVQAISEDFKATLKDLDNPDISAEESVIRCFNQLDDLFTELNPIFFSDLMQSNPNQAMLGHIMGSNLFREKMANNLQQGIQEGVYRPDIDISFVCEYMAYSIFGFYIHSVTSSRLPYSGEYFANIIKYYLRAFLKE